MKHIKLPVVCAVLAALAICATMAGAVPPRESIDQVLHRMGGEAIRGVDTDTCYPATAEEYVALGKNAILMLRSSSALSTELPLQSAYVMQRGVRIPLHRIALLDKQIDPASGRTIQVSFYLLPIQLMKSDARLLVDF